MTSPTPANTITRWLRMLGWHLKRPQHLPNFLYQCRLKLTGQNKSTSTKSEASAWCAERTLSTAEAVERLTGSAAGQSFTDAEPGLIRDAEALAQEAGVRMGGAANLDLLFWLLDGSGASEVIETGVAFGWSSLAILASFERRGIGRLVSVDLPYGDRDAESLVGLAVPERFRHRWTLISRADRQGLPKALRAMPHPDLVHYDSDKAYPGRIWAYPRLWASLKPGGLLISDDIGDNFAFRDFCDKIQQEPVIVTVEASAITGAKYAGVLRKPG